MTLPSFPEAISKNFQAVTNIFEKGQDIYKQGVGYERTTTKPELGIVFMSLQALQFPMKSESVLKFRVKATDKCYTGEETVDLTFVTLTTKAQEGVKLADKVGATMTYVLPYTIGSTGYGTLCWPVALDFSANSFTAGTGEVSGTNMKVNAKTQVAANTPVIIFGEPGEHFLSTTRDEVAASTDNVLEGTVDEPLTVASSDKYVLTVKNDVVGFYRCAEGFVIPQYKAYYTSVAAVDGFVFEETTGIHQYEAAQGAGDAYTLTGVKVNQPKQKGLYIVNGKKVVVK